MGDKSQDELNCERRCIPDLLTFFGFSVVLGRALPLGAPPPILPPRGDEPIRFSQRARRFTKEMGFL